MASRYETIWSAIKKAAGREIAIRCNKIKIDTIVRMVKKIKTKENAHKKQLDMPHWGELEIRRDREKGILYFKVKPATKIFAEEL